MKEPGGYNNYEVFDTYFSVNNWYHIAVVRDDAAKTISCYINGFLNTTNPYTLSAMGGDSAVMHLGSDLGAGGTAYDGSLDDVAIWNRALSQSEVSALYQSQILCASGSVDIGDTLSSCNSVGIDPGSGYAKYDWSTGDTTQTLTVQQTGYYSVDVVDTLGCPSSDFVYVSIPVAELEQSDTSTCGSDTIALSVNSKPTANASLDLSGTGYALVGNAPELDLLGSLTMSVWLNTTSNDSNRCIVSKPYDATAPSYGLYLLPGGHVRVKATFLDTNLSLASVPTITINDGNWHHVVLVVDTTEKVMYLYVDGALSNYGHSPRINGILQNLSQGLSFGFDQQVSGSDFDGKVDEVTIYDRPLSSMEVLSLYSCPPDINSTGLVGYWDMEEGTGNTFADLTTNGNDGNMISVGWSVDAPSFSCIDNREYLWSTGDTTAGITVVPTQTTSYTVSVSDGITSCTDTVTVTIEEPDWYFWAETPDCISDSCVGQIELWIEGGNPPYDAFLYDIDNDVYSDTLTHTGMGEAHFPFQNCAGLYEGHIIDGSGCEYWTTAMIGTLNHGLDQGDTVSICEGDSTELSVHELCNDRVAYFPFNGNANDESGYGNHGIVTGATLISDRYGHSNSAYSFDGVDDHIEIPDHANYDFGRNNFTISYWVLKKDSVDLTNCWSNDNAHEVMKWDASDTLYPWETSEWIVGVVGDWAPNFDTTVNYVNKPSFVFIDSLGAGYEAVGTTNTSNNLNSWAFMTGVREDDSIKVYYNGVMEGVYHIGDLALNNTGFSFFIGSSGLTGGTSCNVNAEMSFDDLSIYGCALGKEEVMELYQNDELVDVQSTYWAEGNLSTLIDSNESHVYVSPDSTTTYYYIASDTAATCVDSVTVVVNHFQKIELGDTLNACNQDSLEIPGVSGFATYEWSTGDVTQGTWVDAEANYLVEVTDTVYGCSSSDTVYASIFSAEVLQGDTSICAGDSVLLHVSPSALRSLDLSGDSDYVEVSDPALFSITSSFTLSAWIKTTQTGTNKYIISKPYTNYTPSFSLELDNGYILGRLGWNNYYYAWVNAHPLITVNDGNWHHVAFVMDFENHIMKIYQDGVMYWDYYSLTFQTGLTGQNTASPMIFGMNPLIANTQYNGKLDEVAIFDVGLSDFDVQNLYNCPPSLTDPNLVGYWDMEEGSGNKVTDRTANGSIGTFYNGVQWSTDAPEIPCVESKNYTWSNGETTSGILVGPTNTTDYSVIVTDGIVTCTDSVTVSVVPIPQVDLIGGADTSIHCNVSSVQLDAGAGYNYQWNTGDTTQTIDADRSGMYSVVVKDPVARCAATDSVQMSILDASIDLGDTTICEGDSVTMGVPMINNMATDIDGNIYTTVVIGDQEWFAENLKTSRYRDGSPIDYPGSNNSTWVGNNSGAYAWYDNDSTSYDQLSGKLYNWHAVDNSAGLCPTGWHVPSYTEWIELYNYLNSNNYNYNGSTTDSIIAKAMADTVGWSTSSDTGAPGNTDFPSYRNKSGFSAIGGGYRDNGYFNFNVYGVWWSATQSDSNEVWHLTMHKDYPTVGLHDNPKNNGYSVRCMKNTSTSYLWNSGDTTATITVAPDSTSNYTVTVSDGIGNCSDTVTVTVISPEVELMGGADTSSHCIVGGWVVPIVADSGYHYVWNTGDTTQSVDADRSGMYSVVVQDPVAGCAAEDSVYMSIVNANIEQNDTTICEGDSVTMGLPIINNMATDIDGNVYSTVVIGDQEWFAENLKTSRYRDGTSINYPGPDTIFWSADSIGAYAWYNNDSSSYEAIYGKLYNWYAVENLAGLCPSGWHVPSDAEWTQLENYLISNNFNYDGSTSANKIAKAMADSIGWLFSSTIGTPGNTDYPSFRNKSGFSGLPGGSRGQNGNFYTNTYGIWQSKTQYNSNYAWARTIYDYIGTYRDNYLKNEAFSVRCMKSSSTSYLWNTGATSASITVGPSSTSTYSVEVSDGITTCSDSVTVTVANAQVDMGPDQSHCDSSSVLLDAGAGYDYQWSTGDTAQIVDANATGMYAVTVTEPLAGCSATDSIYVSLVTAGIDAVSTNICAGDTVVLSNTGMPVLLDGNSNDFTYKGMFNGSHYYYSNMSLTWFEADSLCNANGGDLVTIETQAENDFIQNITSSNTVYIGLYQDTLSPVYAEPDSGWVWVTGDTLGYSNWKSNEPNNTNGDEHIAEFYGSTGQWNDQSGHNTKHFILEVKSDLTFSWTTGDSTSSIFVAPTASTTYGLTVSDGISTCIDSISIDVASLSTAIDDASCYGYNDGGISFTMTNGSGNYGSFLFGETDTALSAGSYAYSFTDSTLGCTFIDSFSITEPLQILVYASSLSDATCNEPTGNAMVDSVANAGLDYSIQWSSGDTIDTANGLSSGIYMVSATDAGGCSGFTSIMINDIGAPTFNTSSIQDVSCAGGSDGSVSISMTGGSPPYTYSWSTGDSSTSINNLEAGPYEVLVIDTAGCMISQSLVVNEPTVMTLSDSTVSSLCGASNGIAMILVSGGSPPYSYLWSTNVTSSADTGLTAGVYGITVSDVNGCTDSANIAISELGGANIAIGGYSSPGCGSSSGSIDIKPTGGTQPYTYLWSTGDTTQDISGLPNGQYDVTVTGNDGCIGVYSTTLQTELPYIPSICLVTVDQYTGTNTIVWEKDNPQVTTSYNLYKESTFAGVYYLIDNIDIADSSIYVDHISNPQIRSWRYKLTALDSCGNESDMSVKHKTIHLTINLGIGGAINLIWDHYEGIPVNTYNVHRYYPSSGWDTLAPLTGNLTTYTDTPSTLTDLFYQITVDHPDGCFPGKMGGDHHSSRSNTTSIGNNPFGFPPVADFMASTTQVTQGGLVDFGDLSQNNPDDWFWIFDGATPAFSTQQHPTGILYNTVGSFDVTLVATNPFGVDTILKTDYIEVISGVGIDNENVSNGLFIYPNPFTNATTLLFDNEQKLSFELLLIDMLGNKVRHVEGITTGEVTVEKRDLSPGVYYVQLRSEAIQYRGRLLVE